MLLMSLGSSHAGNSTVAIETNTFEEREGIGESRWIEAGGLSHQ